MRGLIQTDYVTIDTAKCTGCGQCVEACLQDVLKVRGLKLGRLKLEWHVHIMRPNDCSGCLSCVAACSEEAIVQREA